MSLTELALRRAGAENLKEFQSREGLFPSGREDILTMQRLAPFLLGYERYMVQPNDTYYRIAVKDKEYTVHTYIEDGDLVLENNTISGKIAKDVLDIMMETKENPTKIVEEKGLHWLKISCVLWTYYTYRQVKKLLKSSTEFISPLFLFLG